MSQHEYGLAVDLVASTGVDSPEQLQLTGWMQTLGYAWGGEEDKIHFAVYPREQWSAYLRQAGISSTGSTLPAEAPPQPRRGATGSWLDGSQILGMTITPISPTTTPTTTTKAPTTTTTRMTEMERSTGSRVSGLGGTLEPILGNVSSNVLDPYPNLDDQLRWIRPEGPLYGSALTLPFRLGWREGFSIREVEAIAAGNEYAHKVVVAAGGAADFVRRTNGGKTDPALWPFTLPPL